MFCHFDGETEWHLVDIFQEGQQELYGREGCSRHFVALWRCWLNEGLDSCKYNIAVIGECLVIGVRVGAYLVDDYRHEYFVECLIHWSSGCLLGFGGRGGVWEV